jgi:hypothetical protein
MDPISITSLVIACTVVIERVVYYLLRYVKNSKCSNCCSMNTRDEIDNEQENNNTAQPRR